MKIYKILLFIILTATSIRLSAQSVSGRVLDERRQPVLAASVFWANQRSLNTATGLEGEFTLPLGQRSDTLIVRYFGYEDYRWVRPASFDRQVLTMALKPKSLSIEEVVIRSSVPVMADFAATQLEPLDIWRNPVAAGDPLRAVNALAASTNTQENANPALRGSDPDATLTVLNGVPVYQAVRNSQLNGVGNFSLFNTAILNNMTVYPGNPPLNYGNSAAGLIELETIDSVRQRTTQIAASLANFGLLATRKIGPKLHLLAYGNWQFSDGFIGLNRKSLPFLNRFGARDAGLQLYRPIGQYASIKLFSYALDESFNVTANSFAFSGRATGGRLRNFNLLNFRMVRGNIALHFDHGNSFSSSHYTFGAIDAKNREPMVYNALSVRYFVRQSLTLQAGMTHEWRRFASKGRIPFVFYAPGAIEATFAYDTLTQYNSTELYLIGKYLLGDRLTLSGGIRRNVPSRHQTDFWGLQANIRYRVGRGQSLLLSGGQYHYYAPATYFQQDFPLRAARQVALDYTYQSERLHAAAAIYTKQEDGNQTNQLFISTAQRQVYGAEMSVDWNVTKRFWLTVANTFIKIRERNADGATWPGDVDMPWFVKAAFRYENPRGFSATVSWIGRPGEYYTDITGAVERRFPVQVWQPIFGAQPNAVRFPNYHNISLALSKYWPLQSGGNIVAFMNVNNLPNHRNPQRWIFSPDYTERTFQYFQLRTVYVGMVWQL
jgi:CarboxypepD_reg-like domain/TonB-dependent Receptor Plug Domain